MIDWSRVDELRSEVGEEDFAEVLEIFFEEIEEVITDLRTGPTGRDFQSVFHFLKGSAMNLGFQELAQLCRTAEAENVKACTDDGTLPAIVECYDVSKVSFLKRLRLSSAA